MRIAMTLLALSLSMSVTACKKKKADDGGTTASGSALAGSDTLAGGGSAMADAGPDTTADAASAGAGTGSDVGGEPDFNQCIDLPAGCSDCSCLASEPCGDMCAQGADGGIEITCLGG